MKQGRANERLGLGWCPAPFSPSLGRFQPFPHNIPLEQAIKSALTGHECSCVFFLGSLTSIAHDCL